MFYVNYNSDTGNIVSYCNVLDAADNDCPADCQTLKFAVDVPGFLNSNGSLMMKVDVEKKLLIFKNPVTIPAPVTE